MVVTPRFSLFKNLTLTFWTASLSLLLHTSDASHTHVFIEQGAFILSEPSFFKGPITIAPPASFVELLVKFESSIITASEDKIATDPPYLPALLFTKVAEITIDDCENPPNK